MHLLSAPAALSATTDGTASLVLNAGHNLVGRLIRLRRLDPAPRCRFMCETSPRHWFRSEDSYTLIHAILSLLTELWARERRVPAPRPAPKERRHRAAPVFASVSCRWLCESATVARHDRAPRQTQRDHVGRRPLPRRRHSGRNPDACGSADARHRRHVVGPRHGAPRPRLPVAAGGDRRLLPVRHRGRPHQAAHRGRARQSQRARRRRARSRLSRHRRCRADAPGQPGVPQDRRRTPVGRAAVPRGSVLHRAAGRRVPVPPAARHRARRAAAGGVPISRPGWAVTDIALAAGDRAAAAGGTRQWRKPADDPVADRRYHPGARPRRGDAAHPRDASRLFRRSAVRAVGTCCRRTRQRNQSYACRLARPRGPRRSGARMST